MKKFLICFSIVLLIIVFLPLLSLIFTITEMLLIVLSPVLVVVGIIALIKFVVKRLV